MLNMINTATESKPKVTLIQLKQDIADRISQYYGQELLEFYCIVLRLRKLQLALTAKDNLFLADMLNLT